jgi:hypothetical protein
MLKIYCCLLSGLLLFACASKKSDSSNIKTTGINANFQIVGVNNTVSCRVIFNLEGDSSNIVDLSAGDSVTCNGTTMSKSGNYYVASQTYTTGGTYTLVFTRSGETPYTSTVVLPEAPVITAPAQGATSTKGQALNVTWTPSSNTTDSAAITLYTSGHFSYSVTATAPESGSVTFGSSQTNTSPPETGGWTAEVWAVRTRQGTMASGLIGTIEATNKTVTTINLAD